MKRTCLCLALFAFLLPRVGADESPKTPEVKEPPKLEVGTKVGQRLPRFEADLLDVSGTETQKTAYDSHKLDGSSVFVFMSRTCPYCKQYETRLAEMSRTYGEKGIRFVMVYPTRATSEADKIAYHKGAKFPSVLINDKDASIAKMLAVTKTPEVVLVNKEGEILFRGGIDDNPRDATKVTKPLFKNACEDLLAGRKVAVTGAPLYG